MIVVTQHIPGLAGALSASDSVISVPYPEITNGFLRSCGATALFVRTTTRVDESLLRDTDIRFVGTASAGYDHLDIAYLKTRDIAWTAAPGCNAHAVAEYVLYAILKNEPSLTASGTSSGVAVRDRTPTVGIIGYGNAGRAVAQILAPLGFPLLLNDPPAMAEGRFNADERCRHRTLEEVAAECDIITNHVPLTASGLHPTLALLAEDFFARMKPSAVFVHASRGGVVSEQHLLRAIREQDLRAAVDVWEHEPAYSRELAEATTVCTPHIAGHSMDAHYVAANMMLRSYESYVGHRSDRVIEAPAGPVTRHVSQFTTIDELRTALGSALDAERLRTEMLSLGDVSAEERRRHFLRLRLSYTSRREIITPD
jgi:erythronate-4-phosphate dehydrogenase